MATSTKPKIIVLGGGLAALSSVYWFTEANPDWRDRYDSITVHQMGWRLGGKCASGRNAEHGDRIEEHGLHVWFGFYENAFRTMEGLLKGAQADRDIRTFQTMREAFRAQHGWTLEQYLPGLDPHWTVRFPENGGVPGRGADDFVRTVIENMIGWIRNGERMLIHRDDVRSRTPVVGTLLRTLHRASRLSGGIARVLGAYAGRVADDLANWVASTPPHPSRLRTVPLLLRTAVDGIWESLSSEADDEEAERVRFVVDLVGTALLGIVQDRLWEPLWFPRSQLLRRIITRTLYGRFESPFPPSFESADGEELREWLRRHGAHPATVASGGLLDQFYDVAFAYARGDHDRPEVAAGTGIRGILRFLLGYKGAYLWRMNGGMGDTVFVPFYAALRARGVRFRFFERVEDLVPSADASAIERIRIQRQAIPRDGEYAPLVRVGGFDCWPNEPKWSELVNPEPLRAHVRSCENPLDLEMSDGTWTGAETYELPVAPNDVVVLGIPIACLPKVCAGLIARDTRWHDMVEHIGAIPTYAVQLWLRSSTDALGWRSEVPGSLPILCGYDRDLNSWADMSHLLPHEWLDRPESERPKSIHYFCGVLDDGKVRTADGAVAGYATQLRTFRRRAQRVFEGRIGRLWPEHPMGLHPEALHASAEVHGRARYDHQYWRVNVDPTERYTLSVRGTTRFRLASDDSGFVNLKLAGDWTRNGVLNMGCVEGAIVSGMECAEAMAGRPVDVIARRPQVPARDDARSPSGSPRRTFSPGELDRARLRGDPEADAIVDGLLRKPAMRRQALAELETLAGARGRSGLLSTSVALRPPVTVTPPSARDMTLVKDLFDTNGAAIFLVLACYSLPSAYAAAHGARVLGRTRYLLDAPLRRLCETAQFVIDVMRDPMGKGGASARRVRFIHTVIRSLIRHDLREQWNEREWGVPLNQEDQAGTLMSFSWVVLDGLARLGVAQAEQPATREACIAVWRWIGAEMGIVVLPDDFASAEHLTRTIWARQVVPRVPNPVGRELTQRLLEAMESALPLPGFDPFVSAMMRALLPPDVADSIGVPLRHVSDFATRKALRIPLLSGIFRSLLNDWGAALVDQVMRDADKDGMLVRFDEIEQRWRGEVGGVRSLVRAAKLRRARHAPGTGPAPGHREQQGGHHG